MAEKHSSMSSKAPDTIQHSVDALTGLGSQYFLPEARELLRRTTNKQHLSDDEVLLLAVTGVQAARARFAELGAPSAHDTLEIILKILDHEEVIRAEYNKLHALFGHRPPYPSRVADDHAPIRNPRMPRV